MAESLRPKLSHVALMRRLQPGIGTRPWPAQLLDRIIDGAIVVFLLCSVVSITGAQAAILVAQAAWLVKLVRAPNSRVLHLPLLLPMAAFYLASSPRLCDGDGSMAELQRAPQCLRASIFFLAGESRQRG